MSLRGDEGWGGGRSGVRSKQRGDEGREYEEWGERDDMRPHETTWDHMASTTSTKTRRQQKNLEGERTGHMTKVCFLSLTGESKTLRGNQDEPTQPETWSWTASHTQNQEAAPQVDWVFNIKSLNWSWHRSSERIQDQLHLSHSPTSTHTHTVWLTVPEDEAVCRWTGEYPGVASCWRLSNWLTFTRPCSVTVSTPEESHYLRHVASSLTRQFDPGVIPSCHHEGWECLWALGPQGALFIQSNLQGDGHWKQHYHQCIICTVNITVSSQFILNMNPAASQ